MEVYDSSMKLTTLSTKNQITVPVKILNDLGIEKLQRVSVDVEGGRIVISPLKQSVTDRLAGSVKVSKSKLGKNLSEIMAITRKKTAQNIAKEGNDKKLS